MGLHGEKLWTDFPEVVGSSATELVCSREHVFLQETGRGFQDLADLLVNELKENPIL